METPTNPPSSINVDKLKRKFCGGNVKDACDDLSDLQWFTSGGEDDYVTTNNSRAIYEYALALDAGNTPLPPATHFGLVCALSPAGNGLGADLDPDRLIPGSVQFGEGSGLFIDDEGLKDSDVGMAWNNLARLAECCLPLSADISATKGLFQVVQQQNPALLLSHRFVNVSGLVEGT